MRPIRVEWGKFKFELPGEIFLFLLLRLASLILHYVNV
jgi:hypothetical protein